jgi:alpha-aminoadipate/glutamate carrier protein LysW
MSTQTTTTQCPDCGESVPVAATAFVSELLKCPSCKTELEVVALEPPELALAPEIEEGWGE